MKMKVLRFIYDNSNWEQLLKEKSIKVTHGDGEFENLVMLKYGVGADFNDPIVRECRGLIINQKTMFVVCRAFDKFGNYGESYADEIDWRTAKIQEKVDGSIIKLFYYKGQWRIATNGCIDAFKAYVDDTDLTFGDVFTKATKNSNFEWQKLNPVNTYIFELVSPQTRVVINYTYTGLYHIGTRNNLTGEEKYEWIGVQQPKEYDLDFPSLQNVIKLANSMNQDGVLTDEGFVVVDKDWHRIKVKTPEYIYAHHLVPNGAVSDEKLVSLIRTGEIDEVLNYCPHLEERVENLRFKMAQLEDTVEEVMEEYKTEVEVMGLSRKEFALENHNDNYFDLGVKYVYDGVEPDLDKLSDKQYIKLLKLLG